MISESERAYRRRLLATAMPEDTPPATVRKSLDILENDFGSVEKLKYSDLVTRLQENLDRAELNVGQLLGRILSLKGKTTEELGPDPGSAPASADSPSPSRMTGRLKVFNTLFGAIATAASQRGGGSGFKRHFEDTASLGVAEQTVETVLAWAQASGESAASAIDGANEDLQKIVNHAFVWLCKEYGPVEADKILFGSVRIAEGIPESFACTPKSFL